jgi:bifunctional DNA-binding transcriptional regulator/antitoxin component of YhaV-PrlF toxin-antitoxin module
MPPVVLRMTTTPKSEITVPKSVRLRAGFRSGEPVSFKVSKRAITIVPKLTLDEIEDERELQDPKVRRVIRKGYQEFLDGKGRPIEELFAKRSAHFPKPARSKA